GDGTASTRISPGQVGTANEWAILPDTMHMANFTVVAKSDGTLWAWGSDSNGQLGYGLRHPAPVASGFGTLSSLAAGSTNTLAVKSDGTLWAWGSNEAGELGDGTAIQRNSPVRIGTASNWTSVSEGIFHT